MYIDIFRHEMRSARLFDIPVLYTPHFIPREEVPEGWYCYDLRGTANQPDVLYALTDKTADKNRLASVLSPQPLKSSSTQSRQIKDKFQLAQRELTLAEFCRELRIQCPEAPICG